MRARQVAETAKSEPPHKTPLNLSIGLATPKGFPLLRLNNGAGGGRRLIVNNIEPQPKLLSEH